MPSRAQLLEDFGTAAETSPFDSTPRKVAEDEAVRLSAYEEGYSAGWGDALKAQVENHNQISESLAQNLSDLSFTYHEARDFMLKRSEPVFRELAHKLFPSLIHRATCDHILKVLRDELDTNISVPVELVISPKSRPLIEGLITNAQSYDLRLVEEPTLSDSQVYLRFAEQERGVNLDQVRRAFDDAINAFFQDPQITETSIVSPEEVRQDMTYEPLEYHEVKHG